jgi:hypothetical protein
MQISKPIKILVGLGTIWYALYPLLFLAVWLFMFSSFFLPITFEGSEPPFFMLPFFAIFPLHLFTMLLGFGLMAFYLVHVIRDRRGSETVRIILGVGCFFMPYLAMPVYYYIFIWRDALPAWAQDPAKSQAESAPPTVAP